MLDSLSIATVIFLATVLGYAAVAMSLPRREYSLAALGIPLGIVTLLGFWAMTAQYLTPVAQGGVWGTAAFSFYYVYSFVAIGSALLVICSTRPVYAALWFVVTVLATAGLLLTVGAEFIAFGMAIIYGGAILVTYMFVIMLATQSKAPEQPGNPSSGDPQFSPFYDRVAWEPALGAGTGFALMFCVVYTAFDTDRIEPNPDAAMLNDAAIVAAFDQSPASVHDGHAADTPPILANQRNPELVRQLIDQGVEPQIARGEADGVTNSQHVGLDLFMAHPLGIELAGIILLVSLIGATVIARRHVPDEDEMIRAERVAQQNA